MKGERMTQDIVLMTHLEMMLGASLHSSRCSVASLMNLACTACGISPLCTKRTQLWQMQQWNDLSPHPTAPLHPLPSPDKHQGQG